MRKKREKTKIMKIHYFKLFYRSLLLLAGLGIFIYHIFSEGLKVHFVTGCQKTVYSFETLDYSPFIFAIIWIVYFVEMILRFFPSNHESMGCQKQFSKNYVPINENRKVTKQHWFKTFMVYVSWFALNGIIGGIYLLCKFNVIPINIIDEYILLLISLIYGVCDMICILAFCPFQSWIMKNKCCNTCRIYNYDYAMMFTPFFFIPNLYTYSLLGLSIVLLIRWEIVYKLHPERFDEYKNENLTCKNCKEKLCHYKKQLRVFLKENEIIAKIRKEISGGK